MRTNKQDRRDALSVLARGSVFTTPYVFEAQSFLAALAWVSQEYVREWGVTIGVSVVLQPAGDGKVLWSVSRIED